MGLQPHPTLSGLYVRGDGSDGILYTSHGVMTDEPECIKCFDVGFALLKPPMGRSAGPWDGQLVVCRH